MLVLCYHNGALGHTVAALLDSCTKEGGQEFPQFITNQHLHHYVPKKKFYIIRHPDINMLEHRQQGRTIISSSSFSHFGRLMIVLMGMQKCYNSLPEQNSPLVYKQNGQSFGEQLEILSLTLKDKIFSNQGWFVDADVVLDIVDFWHSTTAVENFLTNCGLTPMSDRVLDFCQLVQKTNQNYFDTVQKCVTIVQAVKDRRSVEMETNFFETAMCVAMLLQSTERSHKEIELVAKLPVNTEELIKIFEE